MINTQQDIAKLDIRERMALYRNTRLVRLAMDAEVERVERFEKMLKESIIEEVPVDAGLVVDGYSFVVTAKEKPTIKDWEKVVNYAIDNDRFDFFQKRLADKAVTDTPGWQKIPGIERFVHKDVSVTKR